MTETNYAAAQQFYKNGGTHMTEGRKKFFHSVFTTALEGGVGYWSVAIEYSWSKAGAGAITGAKMPEDDLDGFYAILESSEDDWGVAEAFIAEAGEIAYITETQSLRVDLSVVERGWNMFLDKVIAATKSEDPNAPCSYRYFRQFVEAWLTDGEQGGFDVDGADLVIQFGLFGEHVYG